MKNKRDFIDTAVDIFIIACIILIIYLKAIGVITLSWFWLFSPIIFLFGAGIILAAIVIIVCIVMLLTNSKENKNERN